MTKTHFQTTDHGTACGREGRMTTNVHAVSCKSCGRRPEFVDAQAQAETARLEAMLALPPRKIREPWTEGNIVCRECGHDEFRPADRTCYGHYANYDCANCGHVESRLTETGMSF